MPSITERVLTPHLEEHDPHYRTEVSAGELAEWRRSVYLIHPSFDKPVPVLAHLPKFGDPEWVTLFDGERIVMRCHVDTRLEIAFVKPKESASLYRSW